MKYIEIMGYKSRWLGITALQQYSPLKAADDDWRSERRAALCRPESLHPPRHWKADCCLLPLLPSREGTSQGGELGQEVLVGAEDWK